MHVVDVGTVNRAGHWNAPVQVPKTRGAVEGLLLHAPIYEVGKGQQVRGDGTCASVSLWSMGCSWGVCVFEVGKI